MGSSRKGAHICNTREKIEIHDILKRVIEVIGPKRHRYKDGYSDDRVAKEYGHDVTKWNVQSIRREMFGIIEEEMELPWHDLRARLERLERWARACGMEEEK